MKRSNTALQRYLQQDVLDIIFEGRNKDYGAYELRMNYPRRVKKTLGLILTGSLIAISIPLLASLGDEGRTVRPPVPFHPSIPELPPPVHRDPPNRSEPPKPNDAATQQFTKPEIKPANEVRPEEELPDTERMKEAIAGTKTQEGNPPGGTPPIEPPGTGTPTTVVDPPAGPPGGGVFNSVDVQQMPEFPGGEDELIRYLGQHIRYPERAREQGTQGRVVVGFVVDREGRISNLSLKRGIGNGCDEEAMRVIGSMPVWKPGKMNGHPVAVFFELPIMFSLEGE